VTEQKQRAAERLGTLAGALREAARKLGDDELGGRVGQYARRAADQVDSMSSYVRTAELQRFVRDAGQFARRRPEVLIGGAFLTGLLVGLLLPSTGQEDELMGKTRDSLLDEVKELGQEALETGKQIASAATETVRQGVETQTTQPPRHRAA
jgi:ElaB/YqjD/DUF883 family membrane-anchored ribosome-binding protein